MLEEEMLLCQGELRRWFGLALDAVCLDLLYPKLAGQS